MPRHITLVICLILTCWAVGLHHAQASDNVLVEIADVDPQGPTTLELEDKLYLKVHYESDVPLRFQALAMFEGAVHEVGAIQNLALLHPPGKGEALAWVMYLNTTHVDSVRLTVYDEQWQELYRLSHKVDVTWEKGGAAQKRIPAEWIAPLTRAEKRLTDIFYDPAPQKYGTLHEIFFYINLAAIPFYVLLQLHMLYRYRYRWRELSMIPIFPYLIVGFYSLVGLGIERSLQITFLFRYTFCALLWLLAVWLARRFWQHKLPPPKLYKPPKA